MGSKSSRAEKPDGHVRAQGSEQGIEPRAMRGETDGAETAHANHAGEQNTDRQRIERVMRDLVSKRGPTKSC